MRRSLVLLLLTATALTGCTGSKNQTAAPSGSTSATAAPATTVSSASASTPVTTSATPAVGVPSSAPTTPAPSIAPPTTPLPLVGAITPAQAKQVANLLSAAASAKVKAPPATCLPVKAEAARKAGYAAAKKADPLEAGTDNPQLLATVIPAGPDKPQYFLAIKHFSHKADHYTGTSLQSFVRAAGSKAWRLCGYPFLFDGVKVPAFGAAVVPSVTDPATRSRAAAALAKLAKLMTARAKNEKAPVPAGLKVPFAESCTGSPCNRKGFWNQHLKADAHDSVSRVFTAAQPLHLFRMADGRTLALGVLTAQSQFRITSRDYFFTQNSSRSNWGEQVAPGEFQALTATDLVQVALEITPAGVATVIGDNYGEFDVHVTR